MGNYELRITNYELRITNYVMGNEEWTIAHNLTIL